MSVPSATAGVVYLALVAYVTLGAVPWQTVTNEAVNGVLSSSAWTETATWTSGSAAEFLANIVLFVPIGTLLRLTLPRVSGLVPLALALLITVCIEVAQIPLERVSDPRDLVANGAGAVLGVLIGTAVIARRSVEQPVDGAARRD